jgi:phospholipid/cholesterol/gamma-HCH transport system permease protein
VAEEGWIEARLDGATLAVAAGGRWLIAGAGGLDRRVEAVAETAARSGAQRQIHIDCSKLEALDTVGAWLVLRLKSVLGRQGAQVSLEHLAPDFAPLLKQAEKYSPARAQVAHHRRSPLLDPLARLGVWAIDRVHQAGEMLSFFGMVTTTSLRALRHPGRIRLIAFMSHVQRTGVSALPIVGLLSFLIGVVFAYQGADQLRYFGAQIFTVNLLGLAFLRELGVLLTAIIVAGRSGSAFTAEIGTMQVNEEIDAMKTLGLDPIEVLVLPRLTALMASLPLLTFYANVMGLFGGALICALALGIPLPLFLQQLRGAVGLWSFWLGVLKAPFFALCIGLVGCHEGLNVSRSAESVGRLTTLSVVESIFLVIIIDAAFSILFAQLHI